MVDGTVTLQGADGKDYDFPTDKMQDALASGDFFAKPASAVYPPAKIDLADVVPDQPDQVKMVGQDQQVYQFPLDNVDAARGQGFKLMSEVMPILAHKAVVQQAADRIGSDDYAAEHAKDKMLDGEGNYLLKTPDGQNVAVPPDEEKVIGLLRQGYTFQDPGSQLSFEANVNHLQNRSPAFNQASNFAYSNADTGTFGALGAIKNAGDNLIDTDSSSRANDLAYTYLWTDPKFQTARAAGIVPGVIEDPFSLGKAGSKVSKATEALLAPAESGALQTIIGRGVAGVAGGLTTLAPTILADEFIKKDPDAAKDALLLSLMPGIIGVTSGALEVGTFAGAKAVGNAGMDSFLEKIGFTKDDVAKIPTESKVNLVNAAIEGGVKDSSKFDEVKSVFQDISQGGRIAKVLPKLDAAGAGLNAAELGSKIDALTTRLDERGSVLAPDKGALEKSEELMGQLRNLSDKDDMIPLTKANQFVQSLSKAEDSVSVGTQRLVRDAIASNATAVMQSEGVSKALPDLTKELDNVKMAQEVHNRMQAIVSFQDKKGLIPTVAEMVKHHTISKGLKYAAAAALGGGHLAGSAAAMGAIGAAKLADEGVKKLINTYVEHSGTKLSKFFEKNAYHSAIGSYIISDAVANTAYKIAEVPDYLSGLTVKAGLQVPKLSPVKQILGKEANGLSKDQQYQRLANNINGLNTSPDVLESHITQLTHPISQNHPDFATKVGLGAIDMVAYLKSILPKVDNTPSAFLPQSKKQPMPSPQAMYEFEKQLAVAHNPMHLLTEANSGTVTQKQVDTVNTLYPTVLRDIRRQIAENAYTGQHEMTYQQRLSYSKVMGQSLDSTIEKTLQFQSMYGPTSQAAQPAGPPPKQKGKGGSKLNADKLPQAQYTQAQRLQK